MLRIDDMSYRMNGRYLLRDIRYVGDGADCVALLGPNGAGKSLLLEICHGLIRPSEGAVRWFGEDAAKQHSGLRRDVTMVLQKPMFLARSVYANLRYVGSLHDGARCSDDESIRRVLREVNLEHKAAEAVRNLSGGEQQCLSLARALLPQPRAILMDEPTAQLDLAATERIEGIMKRLRRAGTKIIFTTHSPAQVRRLCDEVVFIDKGRLVTCAPCEEFFRHISHSTVEAFVRSQSLL